QRWPGSPPRTAGAGSEAIRLFGPRGGIAGEEEPMKNLPNLMTLEGQENEPIRSPVSDEALLLRRIRFGDEDACETLVRQNRGRMLAVARRLLRCEEDRADAVQDAFLSAFRALDSFEGQSSLATWLHRIVVNVCLMKLRSRAPRCSLAIDD